MERILKNTNLFGPDLRAKISNEFIPNTDEIKKDAIYDLTVFFYEGLLREDINIEAFQIPEEAPPRYRRGEIRSKKDKVYELLSYQINIVIDRCTKRSANNITKTQYNTIFFQMMN